MKEPILVMMAAGMGSRYGGLKQLDPVGPDGEVILDYSLYDAYQAGFRRVVFLIKHEIEDAFKAMVGSGSIPRPARSPCTWKARAPCWLRSLCACRRRSSG